MTSGSLWNYYRDEINDDVNDRDQINYKLVFWGETTFQKLFREKGKGLKAPRPAAVAKIVVLL